MLMWGEYGPPRRGRFQVVKLLDRPLLLDWMFYLWVVALVVGFKNVLDDHSYVDPFTGRKEHSLDAAFVFDLAFMFWVQTLFFMYIPAKIRRALRRRRYRGPRIHPLTIAFLSEISPTERILAGGPARCKELDVARMEFLEAQLGGTAAVYQFAKSVGAHGFSFLAADWVVTNKALYYVSYYPRLADRWPWTEKVSVYSGGTAGRGLGQVVLEHGNQRFVFQVPLLDADLFVGAAHLGARYLGEGSLEGDSSSGQENSPPQLDRGP
ncbi:MAG: hypothetical protein K6T28_07395 [Acidothermus sp.]|nr:hypothetical protein [Acidothermus sp.]